MTIETMAAIADFAAPPAQGPTMGAIEAVALREELFTELMAHEQEVNGKGFSDRVAVRTETLDRLLAIIAREVAAARPLIAAECAKVADDQGNWAIADAIRRAVK